MKGEGEEDIGRVEYFKRIEKISVCIPEWMIDAAPNKI